MRRIMCPAIPARRYGVENAGLLFNVVFLGTIISLLVQGTTVSGMANLLGLAYEERESAFSERLQENNCATAILHLGGHYTPPGKIIIFGGTTDGNLERSVAYERQAHAGRSGADIRRAMKRGNRYAARILTWASAGDMRNIALLERCRQEGRNAPDTGRFAVCPNCGNLYPSEYADWYCPACLTEGKRFVLFE